MIKMILKGAVIGVANIIPGVSGGTMAVAMGIYDRLIYAITHIKSEFKEGIRFLLPIIIGVVLGIVVLTTLITASLTNFPVQTNFLFIGLILGGIPLILNRIKETGKKISAGNIITFFVFLAIVLLFASFGETEGNVADVSMDFVNIIKLFGVGVIASATMVIPGVSGSMVLMLIGYYYTILETVSSFVRAVFSFDIPIIMQGIGILMPFGIGVLIGIGVIAKLVEIVFAKLPNYAFCGILGLIVASPAAIIIVSDLSRYNMVSVGTGIITFGIGFFIATKLGE
ncbi:MAG: DUF368 domain-containing protein [Lachnospiraceae bacterium]